jgi:hypothetical protein
MSDPKVQLLKTRRTKRCWTTKKTMGGQCLRWNRLMKACLELDDSDDNFKIFRHSFISTCKKSPFITPVSEDCPVGRTHGRLLY